MEHEIAQGRKIFCIGEELAGSIVSTFLHQRFNFVCDFFFGFLFSAQDSYRIFKAWALLRRTRDSTGTKLPGIKLHILPYLISVFRIRILVEIQLIDPNNHPQCPLLSKSIELQNKAEEADYASNFPGLHIHVD